MATKLIAIPEHNKEQHVQKSVWECEIAHILYLCCMSNDCINCAFKSRSAMALTNGQLEHLSCNNATVKFSKGSQILTQGALSTNVIYLRSGLAKIHLAGPYHEQIVRIVTAPRYLGLPTTIGDKINQYSVTAITGVEVCFIDMSTFRQLLKESDIFSYEIILELCKDELESIRRCATRTQKQTRGNIADMLLEFSNHLYKSDTFLLPVSQADIGNLVDTSRESVSRILTEFHKDGIVKVSGKTIEILNKKSLQLISQNG